MSQRYCYCSERYSIVPEYHCCKYVKARNQLIDDAEYEAKAMSRRENGSLDFNKFNRLFNQLMEKAVDEAGLLK